MKRKRMIRYVILLICIILSAALLPVAIRAGSKLLISRILDMKDSTEEETERMTENALPGREYSFAGIDQTEEEIRSDEDVSRPGNIGEDLSGEEMVRERKESTDRSLQAYRDRFHPEVAGTKSGLYEIFIGDREAAFVMAAADYMFSVYGDSVEVKKIDIADFINSDDTEVTCQILVSAETSGDEAMAYYIASYNKKYDFYSIYAYQE